MAETFVKKSGTTSKGHDYEDLVTTRILFKLVHDNDVEEFTCSSNVNDNKSLDDLVLDIKYKDNNKPNEKFYLQLKHKGDGNRNITKNMLAAVGGPFSLQKYCKCWETINRSSKTLCGIYSSGIFDPDPNYVDTFKLENDHHIIIKAVRHISRSDDIFNTSRNNFFYTFEIEHSLDQNSCSEEKKNILILYQDFFEHFRLYANQQPLEAMKISTLELFKGKHDCEETSFAMFRDFISKWSRHEGKKNCLSKEVIKFKIAEILLKPYIKIPDFSQTNGALTDFRKACLENDVTLIEDDILIQEKILNMFEMPTESKEFLDTGKNLYVISEKVQSIDQLEDMQKNIIMWHMKKLPLVIRTVDVKNIFDIMQFCFEENTTNRKFILIGKNLDKNKFPVDCKMFRSLQDLNLTSDAYKKLAAKTISLQSRNPVSINTLINENEDVKKIITTNKLIEMLTSSSVSNIAPIEEVLPYPYMRQFLPKITIDWTLFLDEINKDNIFVLGYYNNFEKYRELHINGINGLNVISVEQFLQMGHSEKTQMLKQINLVVKNDDVTIEEFCEIYKENTSKSWHHLRVQEDGNLEWISSHGNIEILQKYVIETGYIEANFLLGNKNKKVNIVCAKSGSGKSMLLKYLRLNWPSSYWTIYINFREYFFHFHEDHDSQDILKSVLKFQYEKNNYNRLEDELRNTFVKDGRIVVFWDGLDELPISHHFVALNTIVRLSSVKNIINWITARDHLKPLLEKTFKTPSFSIKEMDRNQQENYIKDYFKSRNEANDKNDFKEIVDKIIKIVNVLRDVGFLGIPLQIAMLTELFYQNAKKYENWCENSKMFTITDLIYYFLKERIVFYFKERGQCDITNNFIKNRIKDQRRYQFSIYEMVALKTFLPSDVFTNLKLNARDAFSVFGKRHDDFGIINQINNKDESVTFAHNVFGEFFVAKWMVEHLEDVSLFKQFFFKDTFRTIRMLFDMMLARNYPLHLAVLTTDFSNVQKYEERINERDRGGRNPLHLLCSWGKMRPCLKTQNKNDTYEIDISNDNSVEDSDEYKKILTFLVKEKKMNPSEKDDLFQWTSVDYANETLSLFPLDVIIENHGFEERILKKIDIASLLYYSVKFNYQNIFKNVDIVYVESEQGRNLLHFSLVTKNGLWFLEPILKNKRYLEAINKAAVEKIRLGKLENPHPDTDFILEKKRDGFYHVYKNFEKPPLILAARAGSEEAVMLLLDKGADINVCDESQNNTLHYAVQHRHENIIKLLIEKGIFIRFNKSGFCPLSDAATSNRTDILDLLLRYGKFFDNNKEEHIRSAFREAVCKNRLEIVKYFIEHGIVTNMNCDSQRKTTALHIAAARGNINVANLLLENKANIDASDCKGKTPLHFAVMIKSFNMVKLLVEKGATLTKIDCDGLTPIWYACNNENIDWELAVTCILEKICQSVNYIDVLSMKIRNMKSLEIFRDSGKWKNGEILKFLVENGADVNVSAKNGITLLEYIEQNGSDENIIQFLISKGATRKCPSRTV